jgi:hypothetical protein
VTATDGTPSSRPTLPGFEQANLMFRLRSGQRQGEAHQILVDHRLYFATPGSLNDPLEARPRIVFLRNGLLSGLEVKAMVRRQMPGASWIKRLEVRRRVEAWLRRPEASQRLRQKQEAWFLDLLGRSSLCCFFNAPTTVHWSHYASGHEGFALAFERSTSWRYNLPTDVPMLHGGESFVAATADVTYVPNDQYPTVDLDAAWNENSNEAWAALVLGLRTKSVQWASERELRAIRPAMPAGLQPFRPRDLRAVILGARCSVELEREIRKAISIRRIPLGLYRSKFVEGEFSPQYALVN